MLDGKIDNVLAENDSTLSTSKFTDISFHPKTQCNV